MKIIIAAITLLFSMIISFVIGARYGTEAFIQADAKFNASFTTAKLIDLDNKNLERLRKSLELDRDALLIRHGEGEDNLLIFLWPELITGEGKEIGLRSLTRATTYRKNHPTEWSTTKMLEPFGSEIRSDIIEHGIILERVTEKYAE